MKIAVPLQKKLFVLATLLAGLSGCQQPQQPPSKAAVAPLNSHTVKKESRIVVPPFVAGKWKAVRIAVIDKSNVSQKVYTIPIGDKAQRCKKSEVLSVAPLLGEAIRRIHDESSVSSLFV